MRSTTTLLMLGSSVSTTPPPLPKHTLPPTNPKPPSKQSKPPPPPPQLPPSSSSSSSQSHRPPILSTVRWGEHRQIHNRINYYAELASKLAENGRFDDFFMIVETITTGGGSSSLKAVEFAALLNSELVSKGILSVIESDGGVGSLIKVMTGFQKLEIGGAVEVFLSDRFVLNAREHGN